MASKNKGGREVRKEKKDAKPKGQPLTSAIPTAGPTKSGSAAPKR